MMMSESRRLAQRAASSRPGPKARRLWAVTGWPHGYACLRNLTVRAATKSHARAELKERFGLDRLPPGTVIEEIK